MSKTIKSVIKLRADTIANWLSNSSSIINDKELVVIKYTDGTVGLKLGDGSTYSSTDLLKFNTVLTNYISDGINTFTLPLSDGRLALERGTPVENNYDILLSTTQSINITSGVDNVFNFSIGSQVSSEVGINLLSISQDTYKYKTKILLNKSGPEGVPISITATMLSTNNLINSYRSGRSLDLVNYKLDSTSYSLSDHLGSSNQSVLIEFDLIGTNNYITRTTIY